MYPRVIQIRRYLSRFCETFYIEVQFIHLYSPNNGSMNKKKYTYVEK